MVDKYWLEQIQLQDYAKVGDKAFNLSRVAQLGYPVTPGFVISSDVTHEFLENLNSSEALVADLPHSSLHLDVRNWRQLQQVARLLRQEMIAATVPPEWVSAIFDAASDWESCLIFRPTVALPPTNRGVANISGLFESQICQPERNDIANALKHTWSQLFRARSLLYWQRVGIDLRQIRFGILVQPLQNAFCSGLLVANSSQWELKATWGLGISIHQGEIVPDLYKIQLDGTIIEQKLGNKMLAYRPHDITEYSQPEVTNTLIASESKCLIPYLLDESQQHQFALSQEYLQQIIQLANKFLNDYGKNFSFEWNISTKTSLDTLYLTQVTIPRPIIPEFKLLFGGIGAASGRVTAIAHVIADSEDKPKQLTKDTILVASKIPPEWLSLVQNVGGIITEQGGMTSHAAILARELGIPAVVNARNALASIKNGDKLLIDGDKGEVYNVNDATVGNWQGRLKNEIGSQKTKVHQLKQHLDNASHQTPGLNQTTITSWTPPSGIIATRLLVNLSQSSLIEQVQNLPVDGVGLLRSELMAISLLDGIEPNTWLLEGRQAILLKRFRERIMQFVQGFAPRPIFYRSLDMQVREIPIEPEKHHSQMRLPNYALQPTLLHRGTFGYMQNSAMFELELTALAQVQQAGYRNINLILPFVRTVEEFVFCRQKVEQAGLTAVPQFQLWIMAEVPSVLFLLPEYVKAGVQGIAIGSNDLTQLLLGVDREQGHLTNCYDAQHPAVMRAIHQLIEMALSSGIPCSICGQAPTLYPELIEQLVKWGITSISVEPEAVQRTYTAIARAEQRIILEAARTEGRRE